MHEYDPSVLVHSPKHAYLSGRSHSLISLASTVKVGVSLVALGAVASVSGAINGVDAVAVDAPARVVRHVTSSGAAVTDVPDGPVEHDGHREVVVSVEVRVAAVGGVDPLVLRQKHVPASSRTAT
ncbi:Os02g0808350 [Oryza sativa Japonica Group]|uniref:Os02g0808350 protein n=1 Tax=Oryza sativa subsp. japonica TaxID=39947 RepID=A0A0P0VR01_ORYSJ|nr:hypothetical protein EE612_014364 [Oryza sativa]BAS81495.1 Os02g0808350 [Oryza sativa Japonica Group]